MIVLKIILAAVLIVLIAVFAALFSKTKVYIFYKEDRLKIRFQNGLLRYTWKQKEDKKKKSKKRKKEPSKKDSDKKEPTKESIQKDVKRKKAKLSDSGSFLWTLLREMRYRVEVVKIKIKVDYGTGDPADTGFLYGIIWAAIGNLYQLFNQYLVFDFPEAEVNPDFENKVFKTEFEGIIRVRLMHIIIALLKSIKR